MQTIQDTIERMPFQPQESKSHGAWGRGVWGVGRGSVWGGARRVGGDRERNRKKNGRTIVNIKF